MCDNSTKDGYGELLHQEEEKLRQQLMLTVRQALTQDGTLLNEVFTKPS